MAKLSRSKKLILVACIIVAIALSVTTFCILVHSSKLNELESIGLKSFSTKFMRYYEDIDLNESEQQDYAKPFEKYVAFTLTFACNEDDKCKLTKDELVDYIESIFDYQPTEENFDELVLSAYLQKRGVYFDDASGALTFSINRYDRDKKVVATTPFSAYIETKAKAHGKTFSISYKKYTIDNPHLIFTALAEDSDADIPGIKAYLEGGHKIQPLEAAAETANLDAICESSQEVTVNFIIKDGKILAEAIQ